MTELSRWIVGLVGVGVLVAGACAARANVRMWRKLPRATPEVVSAGALRDGPARRWVLLPDARWGEQRVHQADGVNVPVLDANGALVAVALVPHGHAGALSDVPWGVVEPLRGRAVKRLAQRGLDARGVPGLKRLYAQRRPSQYLVKAGCAGALALAGLVGSLGLLPAGWRRALRSRVLQARAGEPPTPRDLRLGGALLLLFAAGAFALLCFTTPVGPARVAAPLVVALAGWTGLALLVAPRRMAAWTT